jgi:hypothetical protein
MLPISLSQFRGFALGMFFLLLSTILMACAPLLPSEMESSGNPVIQATTVMVESGYPGPEATPTPSLPSAPYNTLIATPLPEEHVVAGAIVEIPDPRDRFPYTYRAEYTRTLGGFPLHKIFVQYQGREIRLGDDYGSVSVKATDLEYLVFRYLAYGDETNLPLKSGLYMYKIRTDKLIHIANGEYVDLPTLDGDWVLYVSWEDAEPLSANQFPEGEAPGYLISLIAYNISTGQTTILSTGLPVINGRDPKSRYSVSDSRAGWIEYDMQTQEYVIKVCDLNSGATQVLNVSGLIQPRDLSISDDLAVWRDTYWHGYSLTQDALFTIPYAPPGWETSPASIMVVARQSELEWQVRVSDNEIRYFRGPILARGQRPTAWESLVIPLQQTIPSPTPAPLEGTPPAAYP